MFSHEKMSSIPVQVTKQITKQYVAQPPSLPNPDWQATLQIEQWFPLENGDGEGYFDFLLHFYVVCYLSQSVCIIFAIKKD